MDHGHFGSDLWKPALDKYAEATGLTVELFRSDGSVVQAGVHPTPLVALFREYAFDPGLFADCARRCLSQTEDRPAVIVAAHHGLTVVGTSLALEGTIVGAAVAGYAFAGFSQVTAVQRWAQSAGVPFDRLWSIARRQPPVPERRLKLHGELLQVLGDALLRENYRTRQYEEVAAKLQAADAAKDEFLAVLSHELRTPLAPIVNWANVLMNSKSMEHVHQAAQTIKRNALLQGRMIEDLLDVSRIVRGTVKLDLGRQELSALIHAAAEASAQEIKDKAIHLKLVGDGEAYFVEGDAGRLQQVFTNVVSNAVKFTPSGGSIRVTLSRESDYARIDVADTGVGIAPEFLPYVFDMFRQQDVGTRREHGGLGIGLALVKRLVELHKGTVSAASAGVGSGTEVTVRLPLAVETPVLHNAEPAGAPYAAPALAGLSVLVVEDSEDARESLRALLQILGVKVTLARDGQEALEMIQEADPDLVLCDLRMPRMDGYEFIHELHRRPAAYPPVVAVSGFATAADRRRTQEAGFQGHIAKPFDEAAVVAAVGEVLGQRHGGGSSALNLPRN